MEYLAPLFFTFLTSYICIRCSKPIAIKLGLVDTPNARKVHTRATLLDGGIGGLLGLLIASMIFLPQIQAKINH